jgi:NADPH:quinone reductase-like Zn-dependent oxidoreductase
MKALIFEKSGLENLHIRDIETPSAGSDDVLIKVKMAGVNPIDFRVVNAIPDVKPMPHIPGAEFAGIVEEVGDRVSTLEKGDKVTVYGRVFDGLCDMCVSNSEMLCRNGGIMGVISNGGYREYAAVPEKNAFKLPNDLSWEMAASLPVAALTSYHALKVANLTVNENLAIYGASGNTGMFAVQLGKKFGANVIAVTAKTWVKDLGADHIVNREDAIEGIKGATSGRMADVVLNPLGSGAWSPGLEALGLNGRLVVFGTLTGGDVNLALNRLYNKQAQIIGTTGGTRQELRELITIAEGLKVRVWREFRLEDGPGALKSLSSEERDGRIMIEL